MLKLRRAVALAAVAGTGLALIMGAGSAAAAAPATGHVVSTLPGAYAGPLQFAVSAHGVVVADSFASALFRVGRSKPIATGPAPGNDPEATGDLAGVDIDKGRIAYTTSTGDHSDTRFVVRQHGSTLLNVNLAAYERRANPDGHVTYGVTDPSTASAACKREIKKASHLPVSYSGLTDSHPYAVAGLHDGSWLVADAGGNDILRVDQDGGVSTVAVLPPQPVTLTAAVAKGLKAPHCAGVAYAFEAVPTDVEYANGKVYVTTLPGGDGGLGSVYTVGMDGSVQQVATGFAAATNLAVSPSGCIYVVELGVGIFTPGDKGPTRVAALQGAAAVEWANGHLYASTAPGVSGGKGPGHIVILG